MSQLRNSTNLCALIVAVLLPGLCYAFDSGSTGKDGPYEPKISEELQLNEDGIFHFTFVRIPKNVTVRFKRNTTNTPVLILAQGDITIAGTLDLSGGTSTNTGLAGNGNLLDDGEPGKGGPGGFDGGLGGKPAATGSGQRGGDGIGPGAGIGGENAHGGTAAHASPPVRIDFPGTPCPNSGAGGDTYGSEQTVPLVGGSGGGGASGLQLVGGPGGGGGGGAILLAASGTLVLQGQVTADGGSTGEGRDTGSDPRYGGSGSGGSIRIVATRITGNGVLSAVGALNPARCLGGNARIRLETEVLLYSRTSTPLFKLSTPRPLFLPGFPALAITGVGNSDISPNPRGKSDVTLSSGSPNPVSVTVRTTNVPVGSIVQVKATPDNAASDVQSTPTTGTPSSATGSVSINIPNGHSVLSASVTFTINAQLGDALSRYAQGQRVESVTVTSTLGGQSQTNFITTSGRIYVAPPEAWAIAGFPQ